MLKVIDVDFVSDHTLELTFNDGYQAMPTCRYTLKKHRFQKLRTLNAFP